MKKLGVNIDHIATLREARGTSYPDPIEAALLCEESGADSIVAHLREDRRHIKDSDIVRLKEKIQTRLNLEMSINREIVSIALDIEPSQVTFVPEKRRELTTEGGLNVSGGRRAIEKAVKRFKDKGIVVSLFVNPDRLQLLMSHKIGADCVELHTGLYSDKCAGPRADADEELAKLKEAALYSKQLGMPVHAGHGLNYENVGPIADISEFEELNIGHSIIAEAVFLGLGEAVSRMKRLLS
ncbi:MAG: pyridoxine 5'-phosphate synthase [Candidatus Omnitrophica bacterium CG1_02_49_10]|nr:MAG: pyridoxine 5'-phosphate synthase [Candidatus Omnitrophica bacterium CG1_02_49_10]